MADRSEPFVRGCPRNAERSSEKARLIGLIRALRLGLYNRGGGETVDDISNVRMDKTAFSVASLSDESDERAYWRGKSPRERLEAVELLRQLNYGYDPTTARLQRVLEIAELETR